MKRNYQGVLERIEQVALSHPQVNSFDSGRDLELDVNKVDQWPRVFIKTESSLVIGGQGTVELVVLFSMLVMDRLDTERSNVITVMNQTHSIATDILATLNKEQIIRVSDGATLNPLYDYQDTQTAGWSVSVRAYTDIGFECYDVLPALNFSGVAPRTIGNEYIDVTFNIGVYGTSPVDAADFAVFNFTPSRATGVAITGATKTNGLPLVGGELIVRLLLGFTGIPDGTETFQIGPADGNSIFNQYLGAMNADQRSNIITTVNDLIPEFETIYNSWLLKPTDADTRELNKMVKRWVDVGAWSLWDIVYTPSIHAQAEALTEFKNPGPFNLIEYNAPPFTPFEGFYGDSLTARLGTGWIGNIHAMHFTTNDASAMAYTLTANPSGVGTLFDVNRRVGISPKVSSTEFSTRINSTGGTGLAPVPSDRSGMWYVEPDGADLVTIKDKVEVGRVPKAFYNNQLPDEFFLLCRSDAGVFDRFTDANLAFFAIGAKLSKPQSDEVTDAFVDWLTYKGILP